MDLDDHKGNTRNGVHTANMGGTWMGIVNGFAGMRTYEDTICFNPCLPDKWDEYEFKLSYKNRLIKVTVGREYTTYELLEGNELKLNHCGEEKLLSACLKEKTRNN
jgi:alpha,alpha-trehalose phosphorylase